ncbi:MAG: F-box protein: endocytic membrane traffic, recycling ReCYcling 1 [Pycnora praestabilis]|nr:MAG: F-box protein: endocytic membrane traffic, recycling ReCYcling 1 [Pycnora praestabilis]
MSAFKRAPVTGGPPRQHVLTSLHAAQMISSKPSLPAEIISIILDYLPVPELLRFARTSKRMREMVYEDTRWVPKLQSMGVWNEGEARKRSEEVLRRQRETQKLQRGEEEPRTGIGVNGANEVTGHRSGAVRASTTLFDAGVEEEKQRRSIEAVKQSRNASLSDGFDTMTLSPSKSGGSKGASSSTLHDPASALDGLSTIQSKRGFARQEYGKIYGALAPFYVDLVRSQSHTDPVIFRTFHGPEQQAKILAHLKIFAKSDMAQGWQDRDRKLNSIVSIFEAAVLREFEQGCLNGDVEGKMRRYAHILVVLNGGQAGVELFIKSNAVIVEKKKFGDPMECFNSASSVGILLGPAHDFLDRLSSSINEQSIIIDGVFPQSVDAMAPLLDKVGKEVLAEYMTPMFDEAHERSIESYLKAVSGMYEQSFQFARSLRPTQVLGSNISEEIDKMILKVFEPHIDLYLQEELAFFTTRSDAEVSGWERKLSEQDASTESYFMSNVNRQADKRDFLTSFKKVVMMPVNVLPTISPFAANKPTTAKALVNGDTMDSLQIESSQAPSRSSTPGLANGVLGDAASVSTPLPEAPTTELAAKAAIMNSRLEGIRSLFSLEIALNLVHAAKSGLERAALFVNLGGQPGEEAKEQCESIFVLLLQMLGSRHIKAGFDKAVDQLSKYNPRESSEHNQSGVTPLVMFLELVNVGDLIQQMVDVFYEQELVATKLTDRNDFLDPAVKEKKRFEQMLDERVAAGLNKGIDVLMDEIEYICATTQVTTDFNPGASGDASGQVIDISPSQTAVRIVDVVSAHTKMLVGSTDKNMLDVFNQEVGLRLFTALCKHLKRQRISVDGAIKLISDMNHYFAYIQTLKNQDLLQYFKALRELSQIYLIDPSHAKDMATIIADGDRFHGIFRAEEVYEFAERRADWYQVRKGVERAMYGIGCLVM